MDSINSINDLVNFIIEVNKKDFKGQWWWRGQEEMGWTLKPKVFRNDQFKFNEKARLLRFKKKAGVRHSSVPKQEENIEWLFLMQHYGLPTRLLDWTESPLIACFFAVKSSESDKNDGELIALHPYTLNQQTIDLNELLMPEDLYSKQLIDNAYSGNFEEKRIVAIRPYEVDLRLMVQLSEFTIHGSDYPIENINNYDTFVQRKKIPYDKKEKIREGLKLLGIRESVIFPDLDHLAEEIKGTDFQDSQEKTLKSTEVGIKDHHYQDFGESSSG